MPPTPRANRLRHRRASSIADKSDDDIDDGEQPPDSERRRASDHGARRDSSRRDSDKLKSSFLTEAPPDASDYIRDAAASTDVDLADLVGPTERTQLVPGEDPSVPQVSPAQWYRPSRATMRHIAEEERPSAPSVVAHAKDGGMGGGEDNRPGQLKSSPPMLGSEEEFSSELEVDTDLRVRDRGHADAVGDILDGKRKGGGNRRIVGLSIVIAMGVLAVVAFVGKLISHRLDIVKEDDGPPDVVVPTRLGTHKVNREPAGKKEEEEEENEEEADPDEPMELPQERTDSLVAQQFTDDPHAHRSKMEMILNGELSLVGVRYSPNSFVAGGEGDEGNSYRDVYGDFCVFDSRLNKEDPSYYHNVKDAMAESSHCGEHQYAIPLREVMDAIEKNSSNGSKAMHALPMSGLLFHQGHAGAGLLANVLTAFKSTHVISEHSAVHDALGACDVIRNRHGSEDCSLPKQRALVRDVVALLSRASDPGVRRLFLKLDSASAAYLPSLRALHPDAKWTFSYRDAEETLSKTVGQGDRGQTCARARRNPTSALAEKSRERGVELEGLSHFEVCALHLSVLLETALEEHERTGTGMLVRYEDIVTTSGKVLIKEVLPYLGLQDEWNEANKGSNSEKLEDRVTEILLTRSNSRGSNKGKQREWNKPMEEDLVISEEVRGAAQSFMGKLMSGSN